MNNSFFYQLLAGISLNSDRFNFPRYFKDLARKGDVDDVAELVGKIQDEVATAAAGEAQSEEYFTYMAETGLLLAIYRDDFDAFTSLYETAEKAFRIFGLSPREDFDSAGWESYFSYLNQAFLRLRRKISIESFEQFIDEIDWEDTGEQFIYRISGITGYVYLNDSGTDKSNKARFWLAKAISETGMENALHFYFSLVDYFFGTRSQNSKKMIEESISKLEQKAASTQDPNLSSLLKSAVLELKARALIFKFTLYDDNQVKIEENLGFIRDLESNVLFDGKNAPVFMRVSLKAEFARYYRKLTLVNLDKDDIEDLLALALENIKAATALARKQNDDVMVNHLKLVWLSIANHAVSATPEKEIKETANNFRKSGNNRVIVTATDELARYYLNEGQSEKAFSVINDLLKIGAKDIENGGFYLIMNGMRLNNVVLIGEATSPGVSWMVQSLKDYFERVQDIIDSLEKWEEHIGKEWFDGFRQEFINFEAPSHFNIHTFYRYQFYSIKVLQVSAVFAGDELAAKLSANLLSSLDNETNPMSFMQANWDEFKDVPNFVRNTTINKCITISKGDLPLAAEHLDFSYRNLRSYITFKEVNRLGNFLEERKTGNRQLEQGIRLMFHDLYKNGTIFEVVFDMPKFLVEFAPKGFSSQDLEEALQIKGTTAKKYIKIMIEIGLIKHEKSVGRKHFYKLRKDNVMNRIGKEKTVLVG